MNQIVIISDASFDLFSSCLCLLLLLCSALLDNVNVDAIYSITCIDALALRQGLYCASVAVIVIHVAFVVNIEVSGLLIAESVHVVQATRLHVTKATDVKNFRFFTLKKRDNAMQCKS